MKAVVFSFQSVAQDTMVVSTKIARYVAGLLQLPVVDDGRIQEHTGLDVLIIVNGAYGFSKHLAATAPAIESARRIVWLQNDYTIIPPITDGNAESPFRKAFRKRREAGKPHLDFWTTLENNARATAGSSYVNWNCMTFDVQTTDEDVAAWRKGANDRVLYYGAFRAGRRPYFDRYFKDPQTPITISDPSVRRNFQENYKSDLIKHDSKVESDLTSYLAQHRLGLYLEDKRTHKMYMSPANRFYEMLSAGLPMVFQPECGGMMRRAGYDPEPYFVPNSKQLSYAVDRSEKILAQQREEWLPKARQSVCGLDGEVLAAWKKTQAQL
jgi:hypothetical protein